MDNVQFNDIVSQALNMIMQFTISFVPCFMGVYAKEFYDIAHRKKRKINIRYVMMTTITLSCVALAVTQKIVATYGLEISFSLFFIVGCCYNIVTKYIFDGTLLKIAFRFLRKSKDSLQSSISETLDEKDKKE